MSSSVYFKYDGTFEGLMTAIFEKYGELERIHIVCEKEQMNFLLTENFIKTDEEKAERVLRGLKKNFGADFIRRVMYVFSTPFETKEDVIAKTVKGMFLYGKGFLFSDKETPTEFRRLSKRVGSENHSYKGLLRFRELEGGILFAEFKPENDILMFLAPHFIRRLPKEKFVIADTARKKCVFYSDGQAEFMEIESLSLKDSDAEEFFKEAWKKFYKSVAIDERRNEKLMISNMPKRYWEFLPEREE